jgi:uncharacterized membrane protein
MNNAWIWFWAKETLGLERGEIFFALSWAGLLNIALAYPIGWVIDRFGGFRVVIGFSIGMVMSTVGLVMFFIHHRLMRRKVAGPVVSSSPLTY